MVLGAFLKVEICSLFLHKFIYHFSRILKKKRALYITNIRSLLILEKYLVIIFFQTF